MHSRSSTQLGLPVQLMSVFRGPYIKLYIGVYVLGLPDVASDWPINDEHSPTDENLASQVHGPKTRS